MKIRNAALTVSLTAASLAAPSAASAATIAVGAPKPCYGGGDTVLLGGTGFTPNASLLFAFGQTNSGVRQTVNPGGAFQASLPVPLFTSPAELISPVTAGDGNPANIANMVPVRLSALRGSASPRRARLGQPQRISVRGLTTGRTAYLHLVRGRRVKTIRLGRLRGACKTVSARKSLFTRRARTGTYRVQIDVHRRYKRSRAQVLRSRITVFRIVRRSSAGASAAGAKAGGSVQIGRMRATAP